MRLLLILLVLTTIFSLQTPAQTRSEDKERLEHAIDYFNNGKYHEALLLFRDLSKRHKLSERMQAQQALCEYHEWNYKEAAQILDSVAPSLTPYAPHERSVYYFAAGESHFNLQNYEKAAAYYEQMLPLCFPEEKGQVYYRIGFCLYSQNKKLEALDAFQLSLENFTNYPSSDATEAKIAQLKHMTGALGQMKKRAIDKYNQKQEMKEMNMMKLGIPEEE